eukprot:CAMPEP_0183294928 /NCGR_PEP_ID=MMETSP0160_2-20130417/3069_1 /TAXON_ID=2839 ORGANISM="Odontella Sinensis, Strain Grunow 1884" /NCGR_SAMPLE_ID=MMETSP0160_2 /ASSEMBLY_ACC=CAM_ASM_000250 /LENGTH=285 /DNA_ID=CAMNT_0025456319 /DNA_START=42 /DNA_END=896 /DNA_ORIENTATION=-
MRGGMDEVIEGISTEGLAMAANATPPASGIVRNRDEIRSEQIRNYRWGEAIIVNVHITHHAGTSFCNYMKQVGPTPRFNCMVGHQDELDFEPPANPWTRNETGPNAAMMRTAFHMVSWEYGHIPMKPLSDVDWENSRVVSVYVSRDPMDRSLAGDGRVNGRYGVEETRSVQNWKLFAKSQFTNNFALSRLVDSRRSNIELDCQRGNESPAECVNVAKDLLSRFTFVLDQACLEEGLEAMGKELGIQLPQMKPAKVHKSARERINNTEIYEFMTRRMQRDIELYQW